MTKGYGSYSDALTPVGLIGPIRLMGLIGRWGACPSVPAETWTLPMNGRRCEVGGRVQGRSYEFGEPTAGWTARLRNRNTDPIKVPVTAAVIVAQCAGPPCAASIPKIVWMKR